MDAHELVAKVKEWVHGRNGEIGTRQDFCRETGTSDYALRMVFGSWIPLLQAAGLQSRRSGKKYIPADVAFGASVAQVLEEYHAPKCEVGKNCLSLPNAKILVIGDTHFPFVSLPTLEKIYAFASARRPEIIVQVGDLLDLYSFSKFPRSLNHYRPEEEERIGKEMAAEMWKKLQEASPNAKCFQLLGNHDIRPAKRVLEALPSFEHVAKAYFKTVFTFEGVETIEDYRQELTINDIVFHHGYRSKLGDHRDYVRKSFVCGHSHKGGVVYRRFNGETVYELNAGFVGDADSKALAYTPQKIHDQTLGWGYIDEHGPRFIPA